ncbi:MAG TPA: response regulator [Polyangiaceae bacterium]
MNVPGAGKLVEMLQRRPGVRSATEREFLRVLRKLQSDEAELEVLRATVDELRKKLGRANSRIAELYDAAPVGYATLDGEARIVAANPRLALLLNVGQRRLFGTRFCDWVVPSERAAIQSLIARTQPRSQTKSPHVHLQGGARPFPAVLEIVRHDRDSFDVAVADLTLYIRAQASVREREARLRAVFDTAADAIVTVDENGRIDSCNAAASGLLKAAPKALAGEPLKRFLPGIAESDGARRELVATCADGSTVPVEVAVARFTSPGPANLVVCLTDISERKRRAAELEEALGRFREMAAHIDDAMYVLDSSTGATLYVSPAFERIFGRSLSDVDEETWPSLRSVHPDDRDRVAAEAGKLFSEGGSMNLTFRIVRPDGSIRTVRSRASKIPGQERVTGLLHDMTEELALQAELRQAQRLEAVGTLASGIAHDFNNLLMGVGGCAQLALRRLDPNHQAYQHLRRASDAILRGANLTRQILRFSDARSTSDEPVELDDVVRGARALIQSLVGEPVTLSIQAGAPGLSIAAEAGDIEQMLLNLASNARDAMSEGGTLIFRTEPRQGGSVALSVSDTGTGMDEETKRRVFEPFFTTKEVGKGTGLGLSTVFALVRRMGGTIAIDSAPGNGTTFTLCFPVVVPEHDEPSSHEDDALQGAGQTILVVDDDELIRMTVETHVVSLGYRALVAGSVSEALRLYTRSPRPVDVVITDVMMPGLLGSDLARILRKSSPDVAVVYMSAHPLHELVSKNQVARDARVLTKPFGTKELGLALQRVFQNKRPSQPPAALRVFVIDDNPDVVDAVRDLLEMDACMVGTAKTASDALRDIPEFHPDVVLCDIHLDEGMNGYDLVARLRDDERLANTAFLAVTGLSPEHCRPAALAAGFRDVLAKPLDFNRLTKVLAAAIER